MTTLEQKYLRLAGEPLRPGHYHFAAETKLMLHSRDTLKRHVWQTAEQKGLLNTAHEHEEAPVHTTGHFWFHHSAHV